MADQSLIKRSVKIQGHATSISLEPIFWEALKREAEAGGEPLNALIARIDEARTTNLCSAIRVWLFERASADSGRSMTAPHKEPPPAGSSRV